MKNSIKCLLSLGLVTTAFPSQASASFTVPIRPGGSIHFAWVGDLNGDGQMDYLIDRDFEGQPSEHQKIEAYTHNGTFMWDVNFGPNSVNKDNISPGSATIDVGHNDGVTLYDLNNDGRSEVIIKVANGVRFGNGEVWTNSNNNLQWIAVLNGATGARLASIQLPTDFLSTGPLATRFLCGNAGIFMSSKNRRSDGAFNMLVACFAWNGSTSMSQRWKWVRGGSNAPPDGHNSRSCDVNEDGTDDFLDIGFALSGTNGAMLYNMRAQGVVHGDRFQVAKIDPDRPGLQGYAIQQNNPSGLAEYYYDARNGTILWKHFAPVFDWPRGDTGDIDPAHPGNEVWTLNGVWNAKTNAQLCPPGTEPYPSLRLYWDGDDLAESYNNGVIEEYDPTSTSTGRRIKVLYRITDYASDAVTEWRGAPLFYGDFLGDWREEVIVGNATNDKLYILTPPGTPVTNRPSLRNDRYYRNCLSAKGYMQSHQVSYFIGQTAPTADTYPAESGTLGGGAVLATNHSGYRGTGFVDFPGTGGTLTFANLDGNGGGARNIAIRFANGHSSGATRTGTVSVNGGPATSITFAHTGTWTNWTTMNVNVTLNNNATNTIRFASTGQDLANIDEITVP